MSRAYELHRIGVEMIRLPCCTAPTYFLTGFNGLQLAQLVPTSSLNLTWQCSPKLWRLAAYGSRNSLAVRAQVDIE